MNQTARISLLAQRLLGIAGASSRAAAPLGAAELPATSVSLSSFLQRAQLSTEAGGSDGTDNQAASTKQTNPPSSSQNTAQASSSAVAVSSSPPVASTSTPAASSKVSRRAKLIPQGLSTVSSHLAPRDPSAWHSGTSVADTLPGSSTPAPIGFYFDVPIDAVPEGEAAFFYDPMLTEERVKQSHYGCKGATAEFTSSGKRALLHRPAIATLIDEVISGQRSKILVDGWTGAGKSIALYTLAAAARAAGLVVMYIPSATLLTQGGRFYRSEDEEDLLWDTPEAARHIITALLKSHKEALGSIPAVPGSAGSTLAEVAVAGLASTTAKGTVQAAVALKDGLLAYEKGLVIVDDYNALYSHTAYHEPMHEFYRRPIASDELRLASGFRVLESDNNTGKGNKGGVAVVASCYSAGISPTLRLPKGTGTHKLQVPRFDLNEVSAAAAMAVGTGALPTMPNEDGLRRALALTNGNAKELREMQSTLLLPDNPLGLSLGYKALAAAKKQYSLTLEP